MVLRLPASRIDRDRLLDDAIRNDEETARVVMLNGDRTCGELVEFSDRSVSLRTAVGMIELDLERVDTLTLPATGDDPPVDSTVVGLAGRVIDTAQPGQQPIRTDLTESTGDHAVRVLEVLVERMAHLESRLNDGTISIPPTKKQGYSSGSGI